MLKQRTMEKHRQIVKLTIIMFFCCCSFFHATTSAGSPMFIFGDALFDNGNNNYLNVSDSTKANYRPYGISFFPSPTGRFSDGRLIPDFLAKRANLSFLPPFTQLSKDDEFHDGVNFASGGSGALAQTFQGGVIDLEMQLKNYRKSEEMLRNNVGNDETVRMFSKAVYLISTGTNDYLYLFFTNSTLLTTHSKSQIVDMVVGNVTSVVREIYKTGGRKFGFANVQAHGCLPGIRTLTTNDEFLEEASSYAVKHNEALLNSLKLLENELPGFKFSVFDFYSCIQRRIDRPSQYGFKETRAACCGSGRFKGEFSCGGKRGIQEYEVCDNIDEHVFWDAFHFTEKVHRQCGDDMWNGVDNSKFYGSYTIKDLFQLP